MNTIISQTIRAGVILGATSLLFIEGAFAAPALIPVSVSNITENSATLTGYVSNPDAVSLVWLEWGEDTALATPNTLGTRTIYTGGFFVGQMAGLTPGTTYYYRSASIEGTTTVYSLVGSFKTTSVNTPPALSTSTGSQSNTSDTTTATTTATETPVVKNATPAPVAKKTATAPSVKVKSTVVTSGTAVPITTNGNTAIVISGGNNGIFPSTLIGWVALFVTLLVILLIGRMFFEASERRKNKLYAHEEETDEPKE